MAIIEMYALAKRLFPINRSLTGKGVRETLNIFREFFPDIVIHAVPSGTKCFDWVVPDEWEISEAYIEGPDGDRVIDFKENNLHVLGYSTAIDKVMSLNELNSYLYSLPEQPSAIPYITSYYKKRFGFCLSQKQRDQLKEGDYHAYINARHFEGELNFGELVLPGDTEQEIFLSTYICHPSMANNELSGPLVTLKLIEWLKSLKKRRYTYRIVFIPETIGSITYLSKNLEHMKRNVVGGFNITCVGDDREYSFLPTRYGNTKSDQIAKHVLKSVDVNYKEYTFLERGSDERQYCSPGVDLPIASIMRSKYGAYPEYHTSLDDLNFISKEGLDGGYEVIRKALEIFEKDETYKVSVLCEPQLGKRGLYPDMSTKDSAAVVRNMMNIIAYSDGSKSIIDISDFLEIPFDEVLRVSRLLAEHEVLIKCHNQT